MEKLLHRLFWDRSTTRITMYEDLTYQIEGTLFGKVEILGRNDVTGKNYCIKISQEEALDEAVILAALTTIKNKLNKTTRKKIKQREW